MRPKELFVCRKCKLLFRPKVENVEGQRIHANREVCDWCRKTGGPMKRFYTGNK